MATETRNNNLTILNEEGNIVGFDEITAKIIKDYFQQQFNDTSEPKLSAFRDIPSSLDTVMPQLSAPQVSADLNYPRL